MVKEEKTDYSEYSVTKTYSLKVKNVEKIDKMAKKKGIKNKSKILNIMIEAFK